MVCNKEEVPLLTLTARFFAVAREEKREGVEEDGEVEGEMGLREPGRRGKVEVDGASWPDCSDVVGSLAKFLIL